jgi:hypothetical protein
MGAGGNVQIDPDQSLPLGTGPDERHVVIEHRGARVGSAALAGHDQPHDFTRLTRATGKRDRDPSWLLRQDRC